MSLAVDSRGNDLRQSRHVCIFRFAELTDREVEVVSISRDTTESDLKQRRELVGGGSVEYVNQPVVEAALRGRLLVLEGLEKAERNLLPIINNLLENREMALEDGGFLMHPDRVDALRRDGMSDAELASRRLLRVSPDFMVVALGLPVPRFPGTPMDPPLRSRFQARMASEVRRFACRTASGVRVASVSVCRMRTHIPSTHSQQYMQTHMWQQRHRGVEEERRSAGAEEERERHQLPPTDLPAVANLRRVYSSRGAGVVGE